MAYYMEYLTVKEFKEVMKKTNTVVVPVGLMEQHGFHLPLCTDVRYVTEPLKRIKDRIGCVVAPPLNYCYSGGELPGTININPSIFALFVSEICRSLFLTGFKNAILLIGHGGSENIGALKTEVTMFLRNNPQFSDRTISVVTPDDFVKPETLAKVHTEGDQKDWHAGHLETSLMMYWCPDLVKYDQLELDDDKIASMMRKDPDWYAVHEKVIDDEHIIPNIHQRKEIKVGIMGFPQYATKEFGKEISTEMEDGLVDFINMVERKNP